MAYNYPNYYYPNQNLQQNIQPQMNQQNIQQSQNQPMQGGFISVRTEEDARNYPVAPGNSITFMSETEPYVYTKTMGFNQLDRPSFKKYKLVEEPNSAQIQAENEKVDNLSSEKEKAEFEHIWSEIDHLKKEIKSLKNPRPRKTIRKEVSDDE